MRNPALLQRAFFVVYQYSKSKNRLTQLNEKINWQPEHLKRRAIFKHRQRCAGLEYLPKQILGVAFADLEVPKMSKC